MLSSNAKWIWINNQPQKNEYAVFEDSFPYSGGQAVFTIAAETDYILYINGQLAAFGQFAGYPTQKYYDELDITSFCREGENTFTVTVRYEGVNSFTHIEDGAGVIFSLEADGKLLAYSSKTTPGGYDERYIQHQVRDITMQLGLTSGMRNGSYRLDKSCVEAERTVHISPRPVKKTQLGEFVPGVPVSDDSWIYDLGRETVGYVRLKVKAKRPGMVKIAYGEHIADGSVRYKIGARDFSLDFAVCPGEQEFTQFFIRVAARYLEAFLPEDVQILSIGILPVLYPVTEKGCAFTGLDKQIYDTCVRTLRLCMNMHYEDCPWREQALYVFDARNQMLCGYYAFEETEFQRENLALIAKGRREDGLLELTYPAINTPAIPFFSAMYPVAVYEYIKYTQDKRILEETMDTMLSIMDHFRKRIEANGLIAEFEAPYWNFYEWTPGSDGEPRDTYLGGQGKKYHLLLNCAYVYSCTRFVQLCDMAGVPFNVDLQAMKDAIAKTFFNEQTGLFFLSTGEEKQYSQMGNAFALLIGLGDARTAKAVKEDKTLIPATLSSVPYVYDALIERDAENKTFVLEDIREKYAYMLKCGATSFWETIDGEAAFRKAGSLCHGWSAMPVYYYNTLMG